MWIEIPEQYRDSIDLELTLNGNPYTLINNLTSWQTHTLSNRPFNPKVWLFIPTLSNNSYMAPNTPNPYIQRSNNSPQDLGLNIGRIDFVGFNFKWKNRNIPVPTDEIPISIAYECREILPYRDGIAGLPFMIETGNWNPVIREFTPPQNPVHVTLTPRLRPPTQELPIEDLGTVEPPRSRFCCISMEELTTGSSYDLCGQCNNIMATELALEWYQQQKQNYQEIKCPMCRTAISTRKVGQIP